MPEDAHRHDGPDGHQECLICPICIVLQALSTARPEVTRHLVAASRELSMALRAILDEHTETNERPEGQLRRIKID